MNVPTGSLYHLTVDGYMILPTSFSPITNEENKFNLYTKYIKDGLKR